MSSTWSTSWQLTGRRLTLGRSPFAQGFALLLGTLVVLILLPLAILGVAAALLGFAAIRVRAWLARLRRPNGVLDGRRNVRVRLPDEP